MKRKHAQASPSQSLQPTDSSPAEGTGASAPTLFSMLVRTGGDNSRLAPWEWFCLAVLVAVAFAMRIWRLADPAFWCDESGSVGLALGSLGDILSCRRDVTPPVHVVLIHYSLMLFNIAEFAARLPGVILGTAIIPVQYLLARIVCGRRIAIVSSLFVCLSAYQIYYSRDAHGYSVYAFFSWLSLYYFCRIIFSDGRKLWHWFGYAAASVLMVTSHFMGAVACLEQGLIGAVLLAVRIYRKAPWGPTRRMIVGFASSALAVGVVLAFYLNQIGTILHGGATAVVGSQLLPLDAHLLYRLFTRLGFGNGLGLVLFLCLLAAGLVYVTIRSRAAAMVLVLWFVFPFALSATINLGQRPEPRYFIFIYPSIAILAACGAWAVVQLGLRLSKKLPWGYAAALPIVGLWASIMAPAYRDYYGITGNDWPKREVARWITDQTPDGSIILIWNIYELRWIGPVGIGRKGYDIPNRTFAYLGLCDRSTDPRFRAFLEKYPEAAFLYPGHSPDWPRYVFGQTKAFTNVRGIGLARRGLYNTTDCDGEPEQSDFTGVGQFSMSLSYNTEDDLIRKAKEAGKPSFRRLIAGFGFWLSPQDGRDFMVVTNSAKLAVYQLDSVPRPIRLKVRAIGVGGVDRLLITGPGGLISTFQVAQKELCEYAIPLSDLPPGRTEITLKIVGGTAPSWGAQSEQPRAMLINDITTE